MQLYRLSAYHRKLCYLALLPKHSTFNPNRQIQGIDRLLQN
jgi:hypothetical protein